MGPVGQIVDTRTNEVLQYDARGLEERAASREDFVDLMTERQGELGLLQRWRPSIGWMRLVLLIVGSGLVGVALGHLLLSRKGRRTT